MFADTQHAKSLIGLRGAPVSFVWMSLQGEEMGHLSLGGLETYSRTSTLLKIVFALTVNYMEASLVSFTSGSVIHQGRTSSIHLLYLQ